MKLTVVTYGGPGEGLARIMVDGRQVGHAVTVWAPHKYNGAWQASLWPVADRRPGPDARVTLTRLRLAELRAELRRRLAEDGPWWSEQEPS